MDQSRQNPFPRLLLASLLFLASSAPITESIAQERPRNSSNQPKALVRAAKQNAKAAIKATRQRVRDELLEQVLLLRNRLRNEASARRASER